jgi:hypothetical protein
MKRPGWYAFWRQPGRFAWPKHEAEDVGTLFDLHLSTTSTSFSPSYFSSAMIRSFLTLALSVFLLAEASAQTAPAATAKKSTVKTAKVAARKAKKARRVALKSTPAKQVVNDGWPPLDNTQTAVASTDATTNNGWDTAMAPAASTSRGEIDNQNVYAAPGMPVHIRTGNGMVPYSVRPPRKSASTQTTLGN